MAAETISCGVCSATNDVKFERCQSCGARLERLSAAELSDDERHARRHHQENFAWKWFFIALAVYLPIEAVLLGALPLVIPTYDPQGLPGLLIAAAVWFVGGVVIGRLSPGRTFIEPSAAALVAAAPTVYYLHRIADVRDMSPSLYIVSAFLGVLCAVLGSYTGEMLQGDRA